MGATSAVASVVYVAESEKCPAGYVKITEQLGIGKGALAADSMPESKSPKSPASGINSVIGEAWDAFGKGG